MKSTRIYLVIGLSLFISSNLLEGWIIKQADPEGLASMVTYFQDGKMRMDMGEMVTIIVDTKKNTMSWISHSAKKYWSGSPETFQKQQKEMVSSMTGMDPDQYKTDGAENSANLRIDKKEQTKLLGHQVTHYAIFVSGNLKEELWITPEVNISDEIDWEALSKTMSGL